jgi:catechol 2,3-dioxygenase-like lactoylglutathione lyase family enzyme
VIGYVTLGTNDFERAKIFYDAVLAVLGAKRTHSWERMQCWGGRRGPMLAVCRPFDGERAFAGNGNMVALAAPSPEIIHNVHAAALAAGATDDGPPGDRGGGFYGAYFRDPDGNKVCVYRMAA